MSRERVLEAAIALADEAGIDALSMRKLGQALGVEAMSLYNHVANKDDILNRIVDMVVSRFELPEPGDEWKAAVRRTAMSAHEVLVRHPWAASLMLSPARISSARLRYMEGILASLRKGGFSAEMTHHAYHALDSHISGFTLWQVHFQFDEEQLADLATNFLSRLSIDEYPYLLEHAGEHDRVENADDEGEFAFGLDLILDGLERMRDT
ncbi:MAG: TetR/AcrR family transcriptional regulator C-terminal domain-containing protein [Candidatus Limnocylindria bacterium]